MLQAEKQTEAQILLTQTDQIQEEFLVQITEIILKTERILTEVIILGELVRAEIIRLSQILLQELKITRKEQNQEDIPAKTDRIQTELLLHHNSKRNQQEAILKTDLIPAEQPHHHRELNQEVMIVTDQVLTIHQEHKALQHSVLKHPE